MRDIKKKITLQIMLLEPPGLWSELEDLRWCLENTNQELQMETFLILKEENKCFSL